jgi:hypothetical protein
MRDYLTALKVAVEFKPSINTEETIRCYLNNRFDTLGVLPLFTFIEFVTEINSSKLILISIQIHLQSRNTFESIENIIHDHVAKSWS